MNTRANVDPTTVLHLVMALSQCTEIVKMCSTSKETLAYCHHTPAVRKTMARVMLAEAKAILCSLENAGNTPKRRGVPPYQHVLNMLQTIVHMLESDDANPSFPMAKRTCKAIGDAWETVVDIVLADDQALWYVDVDHFPLIHRAVIHKERRRQMTQFRAKYGAAVRKYNRLKKEFLHLHSRLPNGWKYTVANTSSYPSTLSTIADYQRARLVWGRLQSHTRIYEAVLAEMKQNEA